MSHALGCLYITVSVCVYAFEWRSVQCVRCVFWLYMYVYDFSKNVPLFLAKKNLVYFFLSVQLNCLYYWFFCCRCNREMQCIQPTTPPTDRTRPFNTISNSNTKNRLSSSSFFLLASTNRRRRRHHQHNCTIQLFSRIFCSASSFSGINIIIFRCFWVFVNFFFFFSFLIARIKKETKLQRNNDDDDSGRNRKTIGFSLAYTLRFVCVCGGMLNEFPTKLLIKISITIYLFLENLIYLSRPTIKNKNIFVWNFFRFFFLILCFMPHN